MDKLMAVRHVDTARTTNLPIMDEADVIAPWWAELGDATPARAPPQRDVDAFDVAAAAAAAQAAVSPALPKGLRISVFWTDMDEWYDATVLSSRVELGMMAESSAPPMCSTTQLALGRRTSNSAIGIASTTSSGSQLIDEPTLVFVVSSNVH